MRWAYYTTNNVEVEVYQSDKLHPLEVCRMNSEVELA